MTTLDILRNNLIDKILTSQNEKLLSSVFGIFESSSKDETVHLTSEQLEILLMSEKDINEGNLFSEEDLKTLDSKWIS